jgi:hypothetical protein
MPSPTIRCYFPDGAILSGGNFHAEPVAFAADTLALAIAEIGALSERRIALLIDANLSGLPAFLVREPGLNSGFMIAHVTAAALASENKSHGASGQRRQPADFGQPGRPRQHGDLRGAPSRPDGAQYVGYCRDRAAGSGAGHRVPPPAGDVRVISSTCMPSCARAWPPSMPTASSRPTSRRPRLMVVKGELSRRARSCSQYYIRNSTKAQEW